MVTRQQEEQAIRDDYAKGMTYRQLAKKHRKSLRDLARIIKGNQAATTEQETAKVMGLAYKITRIMGEDNPRTALTKTLKVMAALNPYVHYYHVKDHVQLVHRIIEENRIKETQLEQANALLQNTNLELKAVKLAS